MSNEHTVRPSDAPDDVQLRVIVVPLLLSAFLVAVVLLYRCRAHRLRRHRLAEEHEAELQEIAGEHRSNWSMLAHVLKWVAQQEQNVHAGRRMRFQKVEFPLPLCFFGALKTFGVRWDLHVHCSFHHHSNKQ